MCKILELILKKEGTKRTDMEIKKNDRFVVKIQDMSEDGAGIGKMDGYIWFIKDTVIGDVVEARVTKAKKNYGYARFICWPL